MPDTTRFQLRSYNKPTSSQQTTCYKIGQVAQGKFGGCCLASGEAVCSCSCSGNLNQMLEPTLNILLQVMAIRILFARVLTSSVVVNQYSKENT